MLVESTVRPDSIEITEKKVFVNENIREEERDDNIFYIYDQTAYDLTDYILELQKRSSLMEEALQDLILNMG